MLRWRDLTSREDLDEAVRLMRRHADLPAGQFFSLCTAALVAAVATTWYGVPAEGPALHITLPDGGPTAAAH